MPRAEPPYPSMFSTFQCFFLDVLRPLTWLPTFESTQILLDSFVYSNDMLCEDSTLLKASTRLREATFKKDAIRRELSLRMAPQVGKNITMKTIKNGEASLESLCKLRLGVRLNGQIDRGALTTTSEEDVRRTAIELVGGFEAGIDEEESSFLDFFKQALRKTMLEP